MPETRETVRCSCCGANQFKRESQQCARCHASYAPPIQQDGSSANPPCVAGESSIADHAELPVVAQNVKYFREASGMSQNDLAKRSGLQRTYISKVENAKCTPRVEMLEFLAQHLKVQTADLLTERDFGFKTTDPYILEIAAHLPRLNSRYRGCILDLVRKMARIRGNANLQAQPDHSGREPEHRGAVAGRVLDLRTSTGV